MPGKKRESFLTFKVNLNLVHNASFCSVEAATGESAVAFQRSLQAVAIYQHRGKTEDELSFIKNDIITVKEQKEMSWFGELNGKVRK